MNVINLFNCRIIGGDPALGKTSYNIFKNIFANWWFLIVVFAELNFQYAIVSYPVLKEMFGCAKITPGMHVTAWLCGIGSLGIGALSKLLPFEVA